MRVLDDLVKAGYVRYIGMSSCHAYQCTRNPTFPLPQPSLTRYCPPTVQQMQSMSRIQTPHTLIPLG